MGKKLLKPRNDLVFQKLFGEQKNKEITGHLLSLILGKEVYNVDLDVNKQMIGKREGLKTCILDIRAKFNDGEECNIELQVSPYKHMPDRMLQYWSMNYINKLERGEDYSKIKPTIAVLITCYKLDEIKEISRYHTSWSLREDKETDAILTDKFQMHILEIPKVKDIEIQTDELAQWMSFINDPEDGRLEKMMYENNKYFKQARKELEYLSGDKDFQEIVEKRALALMDQEVQTREAKEEGISIGIAQNTAEMIKKLIQKNMTNAFIKDVTGYKEEEIEKIRKKINAKQKDEKLEKN
mgnify:CR=1 FL=1